MSVYRPWLITRTVCVLFMEVEGQWDRFGWVLQLLVARISLQMHQIISVICYQYQSTNAPQNFSYILPVSVKNSTEYFSYLLRVSVYKWSTVLQLSVASISLPMHHSISDMCCQYQSTNAPQYCSYQLPVSVYQCTTEIQLSVASISLPMHHSISVICCQYQSNNAPK